MRSIAIAAVLGLIPLALAGLIEIRRRAEWFIAIRYLVAERKQVVISVITLICVGAVASGVWLIITVLSLMTSRFRKMSRSAHAMRKGSIATKISTIRRCAVGVARSIALLPLD